MRRRAWPLLLLLLTACPATGEEDLRKGNVHFANEDYDTAETHYKQALATAPKSVRAMDALGNVAFERKDYDAAIGWYEKALATSEGAITTRHSLAIALSSTGRFDDAEKILEATIELAPDDAYAYFSLGGLAARKGDLKRAEEMYVAAIAAEDKLGAARYALAMLMIDAGRTEEAERQLTRLVRDGASGFAEYGYARLSAKAGQLDATAKHLERVLDLGTDHPEKILDDRAFAGGWGDPAMQAVRTKILAMTSTVAR